MSSHRSSSRRVASPEEYFPSDSSDISLLVYPVMCKFSRDALCIDVTSVLDTGGVSLGSSPGAGDASPEDGGPVVAVRESRSWEDMPLLRFGDEVRLQPRFLGDFLPLESVGTMRFTETLRMLKRRMRESRFAAWP